ncbi:MAG TPA: hypothetical protein VIG48_09775 [Jatrophihabitans sp.]
MFTGKPKEQDPSDRATFCALGLQVLVNALVYSTYLARLPDLRTRAGVDLSTVAGIMTLGNLSGLCASLAATRLAARFGSRAIMIWVAPVYVLALPLLTIAHGPVSLLGAVVLMMITNVIVDVAVTVQKAVFGARRGMPVMGRLSAVYSLGTLCGGLLAAAMATAKVAVTLHLAGLAVVICAVLVRVRRGLLSDDAMPTQDDGGHDATRPVGGLRVLLVLAAVSALIVPLDIGPGEFATFRLRDDLHLAAAAAAVGYVCFTAGMLGGRLVSDRLSVVLGRRRLFAGGTAIAAAATVLFAVVGLPVAAYPGLVLAGLGCGVLAPVLAEAASRIGDQHSGLRAMFVGNRLAGLLTPLLMGRLVGHGLPVGAALATVCLPCAAAALVVGIWLFGRSLAGAQVRLRLPARENVP